MPFYEPQVFPLYVVEAVLHDYWLKQHNTYLYRKTIREKNELEVQKAKELFEANKQKIIEFLSPDNVSFGEKITEIDQTNKKIVFTPETTVDLEYVEQLATIFGVSNKKNIIIA